MSDPIFNWPMKTIKFIFGEQKIIQLQNVKFIYEYNNPTTQTQSIKQKMIQQFTWNMGISVAFSLATNILLQKYIPSFQKIGISSVLIDIAAFTFWGSIMGVYTLNQLESRIQPLREKWIKQLHPGYVKIMRYLNKYYGIKLQDQIRPYIISSQQASWKLKFDDIL